MCKKEARDKNLLRYMQDFIINNLGSIVLEYMLVFVQILWHQFRFVLYAKKLVKTSQKLIVRQIADLILSTL